LHPRIESFRIINNFKITSKLVKIYIINGKNIKLFKRLRKLFWYSGDLPFFAIMESMEKSRHRRKVEIY